MTAPTLDVLVPGGAPLAPDPAERRLTELYAQDRSVPSVRANMIVTLDGATTGPHGRSGDINGPADLRVFTVLRALADAVLVGAGTARAEGYLAPVTPEALVPARLGRGQREHPELVVVTRRGEVSEALLAEERPPHVVTVDGATGLGALRRRLPADHVHVHRGDVDLRRVVDDVHDLGLPHVLTEGGPSLLGRLVRADLVDELCLTTTPSLVGGDSAGLLGAGGWLTPSRAARLELLLHAEGVLLGRWGLRTPRLVP